MYLANKEHFDAKKAGDLSTLFDVGGIIGGILAGVISDYTKKRATTCGVMLLLAAPTISNRSSCFLKMPIDLELPFCSSTFFPQLAT
ncbi:glucose-6-phosphate exchanger SLC37A1-like [Scyliorhinus canicula]|uniref:glucose-6-phosphate exchanger SLC37A1-like n=1 Tax=Scyliorhinus canicula TaxID=7830 RepID=UPI0018F5FB91|nr:glucose-6-phosphate exchanger SLC37A1-like [Scyliorhinus canicula]